MTTRESTTPPQTVTDITVAARGLVSATDRLGDRITAHAPGCPAEVGGACTCGTIDFQNAMEALRGALSQISHG